MFRTSVDSAAMSGAGMGFSKNSIAVVVVKSDFNCRIKNATVPPILI